MNTISEFPPLTWAEIDLGALAHNMRALRKITSDSAAIMAVVKADGYGHGAVPVSKVALTNGAEYLAASRFSEVVQLRNAGIQAPLLLFGFCHPCHVGYLTENDARASVHSIESARLLSEEAGRLGVKLKVHVKIDTGMGRLGLVCHGSADEVDTRGAVRRVVTAILEISSLPNLELEGIYTHFANAHITDKGDARRQFQLFMEILEELKKQSLEVHIRHAANSAATIEMPETHLDLVRTGIALYGLWPSGEIDRNLIDLKPVMSIKSHIILLKEVPAEFRISYGSTYKTSHPTKIATVPIGYADGYNRLLSSRGSMLVRGVRTPILGRICMDFTMIDVGQVADVRVDDEVVVLGRQGKEEITADTLAGLLETINYEVVSSITSRVEKVYVSSTLPL
jgi:alanine racemase